MTDRMDRRIFRLCLVACFYDLEYHVLYRIGGFTANWVMDKERNIKTRDCAYQEQRIINKILP